MKLTINNVEYTVAFNHRTRKLSPNQKRRASIKKHMPIKAVTSCAISGPGFLAVGSTVCDMIDQFSRTAGRVQAFGSACGRVPGETLRSELCSAYMRLEMERLSFLPDPSPMTIDSKRQLWHAGAEIRKARHDSRTPERRDEIRAEQQRANRKKFFTETTQVA